LLASNGMGDYGLSGWVTKCPCSKLRPKRGDMLEICFLATMGVIPPDEGH
jgi:hypothetical protein